MNPITAGPAAPHSQPRVTRRLGVMAGAVALLALAPVVAGCAPDAPRPEVAEPVPEAAPSADAPPPPTEQALALAVAAGEEPAGAPPEFIEAVRTVNSLGGALSFDQQGRLIEIDLARGRGSVAAEEIEPLAAFPNVRRLRLAGSGLGNSHLRWIADRWPGLEELTLHHAAIDDEGAAVLEQLVELRALSLRAVAGLGDAGMGPIARLPRLRQLALVEMPITGEGLALLASAAGLEVLDLRGCAGINSDNLELFVPLPRLRVLRLAGPQIDDAALERVGRLGGLRSVTVEDAAISNDGLGHLAALPLEELSLARCYRITDEGVERLIARLEGLQRLVLRDVPVRGSGLAPLRGRAALRVVQLNETFVDDGAMEHLAGAENLTRLEARQAQVGDAGAAVLGTLAALEHLDLAENRLGDAGVAHLAALTRLRSLDLSGNTAVSDESVDALCALTALQALNITGTSISAEGAARLRSRLPGCRIVWLARSDPRGFPWFAKRFPEATGED